jgi:hypothetical protein
MVVMGRLLSGLLLWKTFLALTLHLIPTAIVVFVLVLSRCRQWLGAPLFLANWFIRRRLPASPAAG